MWNVEERFSQKAIESLAALGFTVGSTRGVVRVEKYGCGAEFRKGTDDLYQMTIVPTIIPQPIGGYDSDSIAADEAGGGPNDRAQPIAQLGRVMLLGGIDNREITSRGAGVGHGGACRLDACFQGYRILAVSNARLSAHDTPRAASFGF